MESKFRLDTRKKLFIMRVVRHWNKLPGGGVDGPYLDPSRPGWMGPCAACCGGRCPCPWKGGLELDDDLNQIIL